jgi:putative ABC transport system permease protein
MLPRPPRAGKRIFLEYIPFIWRTLKFTQKVTARNLLRQKRHFFMTITGIAGCTALMVAGFGLRDSLVDIAGTQFDEILKYDLQLLLTSTSNENVNEATQNQLSAFTNWGEFHTEAGAIITNEKRINAAIITPENTESFSLFINLRSRRTKQPVPFSADSVILTEKVAVDLGLAPGSRFTLENAAGIRATFTLSGITENYVGVNCYIGKAAYEHAFGPPLFKTIWVRTGLSKQSEQDALAAQFLSDSAIMSAEFTAQVQASFKRLLNSIGFVVIVLIAAAGALAVIVLYNLTNINIGERTREIATLRVLGFHQEEVAAYIFREITILSIVGAIVGLALGVPLHRFIIGVAENTDLMFGRRIGIIGFVASAVMTMIFSAAINWFMLKKIRGIDMATSMKVMD